MDTIPFWAWILLGGAIGAGIVWFFSRNATSGLNKRIDELEAQLGRARKEADKHKRGFEDRKEAISLQRKAESERDAALAERDAARSEMAKAVDSLDAETAKRDKIVADYRAEIDEREHTIADQRSRLAALDASSEAPQAGETEQDRLLGTMRAELTSREARISELEASLAKDDSKVNEIKSELAREKETSRKHQARVIELKSSVDHLTARFAEKNHRIEELEKAATGGASAPAASDDAPGATAAVAAAPDYPLTEAEANERLVAAYKHDMATKDAEIAKLRKQLKAKDKRGKKPTKQSDAGESKRGAKAKPEAEATPSKSPAEKPAEKPVKKTRKASASDKPDDLKKIKGIGKVFEGRLHEAGISSYGELAGSSVEQVEGIIQPKDWQDFDIAAWIAQAGELAN